MRASAVALVMMKRAGITTSEAGRLKDGTRAEALLLQSGEAEGISRAAGHSLNPITRRRCNSSAMIPRATGSRMSPASDRGPEVRGTTRPRVPVVLPTLPPFLI